jgi:hypothetical protein
MMVSPDEDRPMVHCKNGYAEHNNCGLEFSNTLVLCSVAFTLWEGFVDICYRLL